MLTFADGVYLSLELGARPSQLRSVSAFGRRQVPADARDLALSLLFGLDHEAAEDERLAALVQHGMVAEKQSLDDPEVERRLDAMAQQWRWQRPPDATGRRYDKLYAAALRAHARRKVFVRAYGQTPCMPETAVRRALLLGPGSLRVLCIGDDDLVSVPLAMLGHQVTVYDVDDTILLPFLRRLAQEWGLSIHAERRDLMQAQAAGRRRFDAVFTDPMSTRECLDLFLSRGLAWLREGGRAYCAVHAMALETFLAVQRDMGFGLLARHHDFNHYYEDGFRENYYRSDLMVLERLRQTRPVYALDQAVDLDLFSGELTNRQHHCCDILAIDPKRFTPEHVDTAIARIKADRLIDVVAELRHQEGQAHSYIAALRGGGYLGLSAFLEDQLVAYDLYPYSAGRDEAVREALRQEIPQSFSVLMHKVARPLRQLSGPEPDAAAPGPARHRASKGSKKPAAGGGAARDEKTRRAGRHKQGAGERSTRRQSARGQTARRRG